MVAYLASCWGGGHISGGLSSLMVGWGVYISGGISSLMVEGHISGCISSLMVEGSH